MTDIKRIIKAMGALAKAIPGEPHVTVNLHGCPDATIRLLVENGATVRQLDCDGQEWDCACFDAEGVSISAHGRHRPIVSAKTDESSVAAALAQAEEALSS